jgi:hypothetical protein
MTLILNQSDWDELQQQAPKPHFPNLVLDDFEMLLGIPERLGCGYIRGMQVCPGVWLALFDKEFYHHWIIKVPAHDHLVQCLVLLSGLEHCEDAYPTFGGERSYFSGSGISPSYTGVHERSQRLIGVDINLLPEVLEQFLSGMAGANAALLKLLLRQNDWKVSFFPTVTAEMRQVAQQIFTAPFCGTTTGRGRGAKK